MARNPKPTRKPKRSKYWERWAKLYYHIMRKPGESRNAFNKRHLKEFEENYCG